MKQIFALLLTLACACQVQAAGFIKLDDQALTGQTLYVVISNTSDNALTTGTTFATYTVTRGDFDQALTEVGVTGKFSYTFPAVAAGEYNWTVYQDANDDSSPSHTDDIALAQGSGYWTGTQFGVAVVTDLAEDVGIGGPVEHLVANIDGNRMLAVKSRGDGTFGVTGRIRMIAGETRWWGINLAGTQLSAGDLVDAVSSPTITGADSANMTVSDYGVYGTKVGVKVVLSGSAATDDVINVKFTITPSSGETLIVTVPVTVGE
jgi:hypothetical protein